MLIAVGMVPSISHAQNGTQPKVLDTRDPSQDIIIDGLGFSKLILELGLEPALKKNPVYRKKLSALLEKNLCWSGVFNLLGGNSPFCRIKSAASRIDMRLMLGIKSGKLTLGLHDSGPESLLLFKESIRLSSRVTESDVMALVNRLTERITGQKGLLGSTIAFSMRQPGYAKVIVYTSTHGIGPELISHNRDINLLPRFHPTGSGLVYTVLGKKGTRVYYHSLLSKRKSKYGSRFLTKSGSLNTGGAFSPKGNQVVITMSVNQNADLFLINVDNDKRRQLTSRSGIETQAHWSPDGKKLVFVSDRSGTPQVYMLDMETGEDLRLTFDGMYNADPKWSPDAKSILFTKRAKGVDQIHIMDKFGENIRMVTRGRYDAEQAEWSPDGRQVVFASNRTEVFKLYIVSADGTGLRRLTNTPKRMDENSPTWTYRRMVR